MSNGCKGLYHHSHKISSLLQKQKQEKKLWDNQKQQATLTLALIVQATRYCQDFIL